MFKLVVLCAFLAVAVAEPGAFIAPLAYSTSVISPASTTITNQASSVIHPSPLLYSAPWAYNAHYGHLIKKRSYITPASYIAASPYITSYAAGPFAATYSYAPATHLAQTYTSPIYTTAPHFIKKRSVFVPTAYFGPRYSVATSYVPTTFAASAPILSTPFVSTAPITYSHLIKKRSAPLAFTTYSVPTAFSHQSRIDIKSSPAITSYSYSTPLAYSAPLFFHHK